VTPYGAYSASADELYPADIRYIRRQGGELRPAAAVDSGEFAGGGGVLV
jgi:hypothetical protein